MSTLCNSWVERAREAEVQIFTYPQVAASAEEGNTDTQLDEEIRRLRDQASCQAPPEALQAALEEGKREGEAQTRAAMQEAVQQERAAITHALQDFQQQKTEYLRKVEGEVVRLALAIARKVLHREAHMDPLLLAGVVRVALDRVQAGSRVILRSAPATVPNWRRYFEQSQGKQVTVEVVADSGLEDHRCVMEAELGSTELSLDQRLEEIESGFCDLLKTANGEQR
jgi:flagellar assembly protein FliH